MVVMNLDAGEHPDEPEALWALFDVLNIACGGHAGDEASMAKVVAWCAGAGAAIGAHPSYPDRAGFGRRSMALAPAAIAASVRAQCEALAAQAGRVRYVKPHGALYHDAARDPLIAQAVLDAARAALGDDITVIGAPTGALAEAAATRGVRYAREGFADRALRSDGSLVPRGEPGAVLTDPRAAADQARRIAPTVDTICVHGDTPGALAIARAVHEALRG